MTPNLEKIIPPMDEQGRAKRIQVEHKLLDLILKDLDDPELDLAEFRSTMRDYCELKKQDNLHEKNVVQLAIADARLSRRSRLRETADSRDLSRSPFHADQGLPFGASPDSSYGSGYPDESPDYPDTAPLENADPDIDPEWSLAPWGRRKNGKPRTEKEYRTILYRTVRDVYGLDLTEDAEKSRRAPVIDRPPSTGVPASSIAATFDIRDPTSDIESSDIPHPTSDIPSPRSPPGSREVSPFCRPDAPFLPKPTNPWYDF